MTRPPKSSPSSGTAKAAKKPSAKQFRFGYLVHDVSRVRRTLMDKAMRPLGLTRSQWSVLSTLSRGGNDGMMQADLARLMEVGKVTVGGLVDRMEASGHVTRRPDADDRRAKRVFITQQGFEVVRLMIRISSKVNDLVLKGVSPDHQQITEAVLLTVKLNITALLADDAGGATGVFGSRLAELATYDQE